VKATSGCAMAGRVDAPGPGTGVGGAVVEEGGGGAAPAGGGPHPVLAPCGPGRGVVAPSMGVVRQRHTLRRARVWFSGVCGWPGPHARPGVGKGVNEM